MFKMLLIHPEKCLGCRICEMFCSLFHTDTCNSAKSRINIVKMNYDVYCVPMMCQQCADAPCETACPMGAISRNERTGAMETNLSRCVRCRACFFACPFGATSFDLPEKVVVRCDLCEGEAMCAEVCPYGAITYLEEDRQGLHKKRDAV